MSLLVAECPRCKVKEMTFDLLDQIETGKNGPWQIIVEIFCVCRACHRSTVFIAMQKEPMTDHLISNGLRNLNITANKVVEIIRPIGIQDNSAESPPDYLPEDIDRIFKEGAACMAINCHNAAATMFRLCLDLATKSLLPEQADGLTSPVRRNLGLRLPWLFETQRLPETLRDLSTCIKDDGNDGAHEGILSQEEAADILDFTFILLERLYTEPKRLELASQRRAARRER